MNSSRALSRSDIPDPSEFLYLGSPVARALLAVIVLTQVVFAAFSLDVMAYPALDVIALIIFAAAATLLANPRRGPFPLSLTAAVIAAGAVVTALVEAGLPDGWPGYAAWNFGAVTWLAFFLAFRGRIAAAWICLLAMFLVTLVWAVIVGRGPLDAVDLTIRHVGTLLIATLFRILLTRGAQRVSAFRRERISLAASEAASETMIVERNQQASQLAGEARPVLVDVARGEYLKVEETRRCLLLEAALRDALRGRELATPEISAAAGAARARGAEVVLLDDRAEELPAEDAALIVPAVVSELETLIDGRITVRLLPVGRDVIATVVRDDPQGYRRRDFASPHLE